ncbi:transport permease protein [Streptomyces spiroverticillatus]|uniref:Transport permease protein n=1 Tax=Streptomyces finlayi TaxID=67296 RepID=A0A918X455_9ACTN|nr:ABC transporter permease [Streptomyces finlayi]GHA32880.1 transport permease protein [Streptomyces spiroverticillatus]GHD10272.1 transport permease protein [Streptomyces finlayi]
MTTAAPAPTHAHRPVPGGPALAAVFKAEGRLFLREPGSLFWMIGFPTALLVILGLIPSFREANPDLGGRRVIDLYVPIAVLLGMIMASIQAMPPVLTSYRERGILRRLSTTPVRPPAILGAQIALHGIAMIVSSLLAITVGRLAFGVALPFAQPGYILSMLLMIACALALGATLSAVAATTKAATAIGSVAFLVMMFTSGVWMPVQTMPDLLQTIVSLTPFGAASQALDRAMLGSWPEWQHLGIMVLWAAGLTGAASRWFRWE